MNARTLGLPVLWIVVGCAEIAGLGDRPGVGMLDGSPDEDGATAVADASDVGTVASRDAGSDDTLDGATGMTDDDSSIGDAMDEGEDRGTIDAASEPVEGSLDSPPDSPAGCHRHRRYVAGDMDNDGHGDIAFVETSGTPSVGIPVAYSRGDGNFDVIASDAAIFPVFATQGPLGLLGGDVNGDGRLDLILTGGNHLGVDWETVPVALSVGTRSFAFVVTNALLDPLSQFGEVAATPGITSLSGDFDGDGLFDIALVGEGATATFVALSNGNGSFQTGITAVPPAFGAAVTSAARVVSGDFDGDGVWDVAVVRAGTDSIEIAYGTGGRSGVVPLDVSATAAGLSTYPLSGAVALAGDFNGDGRDDLAFVRTDGDVVLAFSVARDVLKVVAAHLPALASLPSQPGGIVSLDADGDGCSDLAVVGGAVSTGGSTIATLPVAFSNGDGTFRVTTQPVPGLPASAGIVGLSAGAGSVPLP